MSFLKSKKISGLGSASNKYFFMLDSIGVAKWEENPVNLYDSSENIAIKYIENRKNLRDSIAHIVFYTAKAIDKYQNYFDKLTELENEFLSLRYLLAYLDINVSDYSKYADFITSNFNNQILNNLYKTEYLSSSAYRALMSDEYVNFLVKIDYQKDSTLRTMQDYNLKKINTTYKGKIKEYALCSIMKSLIKDHCKSFQTLNDYKVRFEPYISNLNDTSYTKALADQINSTEEILKRTQAGQPAPPFTLASNTGKTYSLRDFEGKVVYLDLWASWCHPCREETPYLKSIYEKYKMRNDIEFVSVSLDESKDRWKEALAEDQPTWLQLIDKERVVSTSYVANFIPQFIIIDKKGNIVDFDSPRPSNIAELEKIFESELAK